MSKGKGWHSEPYRHSLASRGIRTRFEQRTHLKEPTVDRETDYYYDPMKGDCVYYARALRDKLGKGENYQVGPHNVLKIGNDYIDAEGTHTKEELINKYGYVPRLDPDGWNYILDESRLNYYRNKVL